MKRTRLIPVFASLLFVVGCVQCDAKDLSDKAKQATAALSKGQNTQARELLQTALKLDPRDADLWALLTFCTNKPLENAKEAIRLNEKSDLAHIALGSVQHEQNGYDAGIDEFTKAIVIKHTTLAYNARGKAYAGLGIREENERAVQDFDKAIELNDQNVVAYLNRGNAYHDLGMINSSYPERKALFDKAITDFTNALKIDPACIDAYILRGRAYNVSGEQEKAIADFTKAIALDPEQATFQKTPYIKFQECLNPYTSEFMGSNTNFRDAYTYRIQAYRANQQYANAINDLTTFLKKKYPLPLMSLYRQRAEIFAIQGKLYKAIEDYSRELALMDEYGELQKGSKETWDSQTELTRARLHDQRGALFLQLRNFHSALDDANIAIQLQDKHPTNIDIMRAGPYLTKGICLSSGEMHASAIEMYSKALEWNSDLLEAYLNRAAEYASTMNYQSAIKDFSKALEMAPRSALALRERGICYLRTNDFERALADLGSAISLSTNDVAGAYRARFHRAQIYSRQGEHGKAINDLSALIQPDRRHADAYFFRAQEFFHLKKYKEAAMDTLRGIFVAPAWLVLILIPILIFFLIEKSRSAPKKDSIE